MDEVTSVIEADDVGAVFQPEAAKLSTPSVAGPPVVFKAGVPPDSLDNRFDEGEIDEPPAAFREDEPRFVERSNSPWLLPLLLEDSRRLLLDEALAGGGGGLVNLLRFLPNFFLLLENGCSTFNKYERG